MSKELKTVGVLIIASAIIWGLVIIGCSLALKDTGCYDKIQNILVGGVITHLILIWGPLVVVLKKSKSS
jgi:hypothetical protein